MPGAPGRRRRTTPGIVVGVTVLQPDAFADHLGVEVERTAPGHARAVLTLDGRHANPHGTAHGAVLYSLAGIALAAAANDDTRSGIVSAVHIDYLAPAAPGESLTATAGLSDSTAREDVFVVRVVRDADDVLIARATGRATRRARA